jgi:hypothetical protein
MGECVWQMEGWRVKRRYREYLVGSGFSRDQEQPGSLEGKSSRREKEP